MAMKFGIGLPTCAQGVYLPTPFAGPDEMVRVAQVAERVGFHSAWSLDFMTLWDDPVPPESKWPEWHEALMSLSFVASQTTTIRLGTSSIQLPLRDPFLFAKQFATLDVLSKGRAMVGVGLGVYRSEYLRLNARGGKVHRGTLFDEYLEAMYRFFNEGAVTFEGKYYACKDVALVPKPVQKPFPIYMSGRTDDTFRRVAKWSNGWFLSRLRVPDAPHQLDMLDPYLAEVGRSRKDIDVTVTNGLSLAKTQEEAARNFDNSVYVKRQGVLSEILDPVSTSVKIVAKPSEDKINNFIGTPDNVIEQAKALEAKGITHCILLYNAVNTVQKMCDQLQWFGEAVIPKFK